MCVWEVIIMALTRVIENENGQALRIPQEMKTEKSDYCISKIGDIYVAYPSDDPWAPVKEVIGSFPDDYMSERDQPSADDVIETCE